MNDPTGLVTPPAALVCRTYLETIGDLDPDCRGWFLAFTAARLGHPDLARWFADTGDAGGWAPRWVSGDATPLSCVATASLGRRPVAVTGGDDGTVRVWDLATRAERAVLTGHTGRVVTVATAVLDGHPVAVTGAHDRTVRVWHLPSGRQHTPALPFPVLPVPALAATATGDLLVTHGRSTTLLTRVDMLRG